MKKLHLLFLALITSLFVKAQCNSTNSPTFQITSTGTLAGQGNYTIGCNNYSLTVINIVNANTNPTPGGALLFCFMPPEQANCTPAPLPQYTVVNTPGIWTIVVLDMNGCQTSQTVAITQNTVAPNVSVNVPLNVLDCATPSVILTASSASSNIAYRWYLNPAVFVQGSTMLANTNTGVPNGTVAATYTLVATNQNNGCVSNTVITIAQNIFPPIPSILATSKTLTCITPTLQLSNAGTTGIPPSSGFPTNGNIQAILWQGPAPQPTMGFVSSYIAGTPGVYTMTVEDSNNGCVASKTIVIQDGRVYPVINNSIFHLCTNTVVIYPTLTGSMTSYSYSWAPNSAIVSGNTTVSSIIVNAIGVYSVLVTNQINGCATAGTVMVTTCVGIQENQIENFNIYPNPSAGEFFFEGNFAERTQIIIRDAVGKQIMKNKLDKGSNSVRINAEHGLYFYQLISGGKQVATGKLLVE